jgi:hypothetical protein
MPPLTILPDSDVKRILHSLTKSEIEELQQALRKSLSAYSTTKQSEDERALTQPERTVIESDKSNGKSTTLFMPSTSAEGLGMKGRLSVSVGRIIHLLLSFVFVMGIRLTSTQLSLSPLLGKLEMGMPLLKALSRSWQTMASRLAFSMPKRSLLSVPLWPPPS